MSRIYVKFSALEEIGNQCAEISSNLDDIRSEIQYTIRNLDWDVKFQSDIVSTGNRAANQIQKYNQVLKSYKAFLNHANKMYKELDAVEFELKIRAGRTNIFDENIGYGGDQGDMAHSKNGTKIFFWVINEDKEIYDFVKQQEGYENYSESKIHDLLDQINHEGCGYVALANTLFWEFQGTDAEFEEMYGFPMRDKDGNYNYNKMLIDIYCKTDNKFSLTEENGKEALVYDVVNKYENNQEQFKKDYGVDYNSDVVVRANAILSKFDDDVVTFEKDYTTVYSQHNRLISYLHMKGIDADVSCSIEEKMSFESVRNTMDSGTVVELALSKGTELCDENGNVQNRLSMGHAVLITGTTDDGRYIISSWGNKYYVDPSQIVHTDSGEEESIISNYLCMNVNY